MARVTESGLRAARGPFRKRLERALNLSKPTRAWLVGWRASRAGATSILGVRRAQERAKESEREGKADWPARPHNRLMMMISSRLLGVSGGGGGGVIGLRRNLRAIIVCCLCNCLVVVGAAQLG